MSRRRSCFENLREVQLFMCHQMAMKKEADDKQKALEVRRAQIGVGVPIIWILGGPGCGKGTQCEKIVAKYGFTHLSSGDLLREEVKSGSAKGNELAKIMQEGKLVSNSDVLMLLQSAIMKKIASAKGFLIDGYPREKDQGAAFESLIASPALIIFFDCSDETLVARFRKRAATATEVRADDNEETFKTRIATFRTNTNAILSQYTQKTSIINAERSVDEIFADVTNAIESAIRTAKCV